MNRVLLGASLLVLSIAFAACSEPAKQDGSAKPEDKKTGSAEPKKADSSAKAAGKTEGTGKPKAEKTAAPSGEASAAPAPSGEASAAAPPTGAMDVTHTNLGTREKPVTMPTQQTYSMEGIKTISDTCSKAHVILVQAPESVGVDYEWKYSKQAMLANQQYKVVDGAPTVQGEVSFEVHQADEKMQKAWVLVANCVDGVTCNHLAAMYKSIVKSSNPQVFCGDIPPHLGAKKKDVNLLAGGPEANLPKSGDTISQCARLAACTIADKTDTKDDVGINCQKAPQSFKTDCASKYPCAEVLACAK